MSDTYLGAVLTAEVPPFDTLEQLACCRREYAFSFGCPDTVGVSQDVSPLCAFRKPKIHAEETITHMDH